MIVVAKMYVASVIDTGNVATDLTTRIVNLNTVYSPDPNTENHSFWKASPSGTLRLTYPSVAGEPPCVFRPGQTFKVYHEPVEDGEWKIAQNSIDDGRMTLKLGVYIGNEWWKFFSAMEEMMIDNKEVFPVYADPQQTFKVRMVEVDRNGDEIGESFYLS